MKKNRIPWDLHTQSDSCSYQSFEVTTEGAESRAENAEQSCLCVPLRNPLHPPRFKNDLGNHTMSLARLFILAIALLFCSPVAFSQSHGSISGKVADPQGASVAGAEVHLRSRSGSQSLAITDDNGAYSFRNVAPGDYVLEIKKDGFASSTSNQLTVTRGQ